MQVIIYNNDSGLISIIYPTEESLITLGINEIARKDVPIGKPYKILNIEDFPLDGTINELGIPNIDNTYRDAWEADFSEPDGFGIGAEAWFAEFDLIAASEGVGND